MNFLQVLIHYNPLWSVGIRFCLLHALLRVVIYIFFLSKVFRLFVSYEQARWDILKAYVVEFKIFNFCCEYLPLLLSCSLRGFGCMYISDKQLDDQYEARDFYLSNKIIVLKVIR